MSKNLLPMHLLKLGEGSNIMVQLKSGETYNGISRGVDKFMNIKMDTAYLSDKNGKTFHSVKEVYIRGNNIKYVSMNDDIISKIEGTEYVCPDKWKKSDIKNNKVRSKKTA